jgi:hypothetical protein
MARTLLELVKAFCNEVGITEPQQLFGSQNDQEKQLISLANREGKDFAKMANKNGGWQELRKDYAFNTEIVTGLTGDVTDGSAVITNISSTASLSSGGVWGLTANGLTNPAFIVTVDSATQITVNQPFTESGTGVALTIGKVAYPMPSDFEYFVQKTFWDNKYKWELLGPINAQEKQILRYGVVASGPRNKFYIRDNKMWLDPMPTESALIAYDYYSNAWCQSNSGAVQTLWAADTDVYLLNEECFIEGMKWRFLRAKGLDYAEEKRSYDMECERIISRDGGSRDLSLNSNGYTVQFLSDYNIQDGNFPSGV